MSAIFGMGKMLSCATDSMLSWCARIRFFDSVSGGRADGAGFAGARDELLDPSRTRRDLDDLERDSGSESEYSEESLLFRFLAFCFVPAEFCFVSTATAGIASFSTLIGGIAALTIVSTAFGNLLNTRFSMFSISSFLLFNRVIAALKSAERTTACLSTRSISFAAPFVSTFFSKPWRRVSNICTFALISVLVLEFRLTVNETRPNSAARASHRSWQNVLQSAS